MLLLLVGVPISHLAVTKSFQSFLFRVFVCHQILPSERAEELKPEFHVNIKLPTFIPAGD